MLDDGDRNEAVDRLLKDAVAGLREAQGRMELIREAILSYLRGGYAIGLVPGEVVDFFCVDTPNIVEEAGYADAAGDEVVDLFDELHDEVRRAGNGRN